MSDPQASGDTGRDIPRWKVVVASVVLTVLFGVALGVALLRGGVPGGQPRDAVAASAPAAARSAGPPASPPPGAAPSRPAATPPEASQPAGAHDVDAAAVAAVHAALDAWERFARSADLDDVRQAFVVGGPQHAQFRAEVRQGRAGVDRVPAMSLRSVTAVTGSGRRREVTGRVVLAGEGATAAERVWRFELRRRSGAWRVWTVIDLS